MAEAPRPTRWHWDCSSSATMRPEPGKDTRRFCCYRMNLRSWTETTNMRITRRDLLARAGMGFASLGLMDLLARQKLLTAAPVSTSPLAPRPPHFPGKAQRVIHLFMNGGPSHVDTFDPKPMLARLAGQPLPRPNLRTERRTGAA